MIQALQSDLGSSRMSIQAFAMGQHGRRTGEMLATGRTQLNDGTLLLKVVHTEGRRESG